MKASQSQAFKNEVPGIQFMRVVLTSPAPRRHPGEETSIERVQVE